MTLDKLYDLTIEWSKERMIIPNSSPRTQFLKLVSEVGELADGINKEEDLRDHVGDCLVVLANLSYLAGFSLMEAWELAYEEIKDRKGVLTREGNFIKDTDPRYGVIMEIIGKKEEE